METFEFIEGEGLCYGNIKVSDFDNYVERKVLSLDEQGRKRTMYEVIVKTKEGESLPGVRLESLRNIHYFDIWEKVTDAELSAKGRKLLELRLQQTAQTAKENTEIVCNGSGIITYEQNVWCIIGDRSWEKSKTGDIQLILGKGLKKYKWISQDSTSVKRLDSLKLLTDVAPGCSEIIFSAVLLAVAKPFFVKAGYTPEFCINLYGKSGTHKTSLVKAIATVMETERLQIGSFINDSKRELLSKIEKAYGFPFVLDDYHPVMRDYDLKKQNAVLDSVVRQMESVPQSAFVIMTSEFLDGCYSLQDRMLQIAIRSVDLEKLSQLQNQKGYTAYILLTFIDILIQNYDEVIELIKMEFSEESPKLCKTGKRVRRNGFFLKVAAKLYSKYLHKGEETIVSNLDKALTEQAEIQEKHLNAIKRYHEDKDYVSMVYELLNSQALQICSSVDKEYSCQNDQCFMKEPQIIYITKNALMYAMQKQYGSQVISVGEIVKALHENDILLEDSDAKTKKFKGIRHICFSYVALENYVIINHPELVPGSNSKKSLRFD